MCVINSSTGIKNALVTTTVNSNVSIVPNCGMYVLNVAYFDGANDFRSTLDTQTIADATNAVNRPMVCAYCLPGYKATFVAGNDDHMVSSCAIITNCRSSPVSPWVNSCSECEDNFSWKWDSNSNKIDYTECVSSGS